MLHANQFQIWDACQERSIYTDANARIVYKADRYLLYGTLVTDDP